MRGCVVAMLRCVVDSLVWGLLLLCCCVMLVFTAVLLWLPVGVFVCLRVCSFVCVCVYVCLFVRSSDVMFRCVDARCVC